MLATHRRNLDMDCIGLSELEHAPITTGYVESGFAHLDLVTRTLVGAGMLACIGVAHASILKAFDSDGTRRAATRAAMGMERRSTGGSSSGAAVNEAEADAKADEFRVTSFFSFPKEERWMTIRDLQKR